MLNQELVLLFIFIDQQDSENNVTEEEEAKKKDNIENVEEEKEEVIIKSEKEDNPIVDSPDISITKTVLVQKDVVEGDTNQSSTAEEKPTSNLSGPLKSEQRLIELQQFTGKEQRQQIQQEQLTEQEQQQLTKPEQQKRQQLTDNVLFNTSPKSESGGDISTSNNSNNSNNLNNPYYNKLTMFTKPENQIASDSQSHAFYSETTDIDPKHLVEISEDGMLSLRHVEIENSNSNSNYSSLISPGLPVEPLSSNTSNSNIVLLPKQIIRIERDYCKGELCQFQDSFPVEIDGRVNPRRFQRTINTLNQKLEKAFDPKYNCLDNFLACVTIYTSTLCMRPHFEKMIEEICIFLDNENQTIYNPNGLNFRNPQRTSFLFLELEFY
ncbi:hypothetical protein Glove_579g11 [Diversispora epigaea]|uniref:Ras modification protein ERF4 n=1 Tax=Diversispora epigaea TaxID=1348612 RepID=A0A397GA79_9GLOM|nr:hypothetical protein Glove_579g11 [Diversispora epigaea]